MASLPAMLCPATMVDAENAPDITYHCTRTDLHVYSHKCEGPDGEVLAWWCTCPECEEAVKGEDEPLTAPCATPA